MDPKEYEKMFHLEDTYWWYQGRKRVVSQLLGLKECAPQKRPRILDVGCGTGLMLQEMQGRAHCVGMDFSPLSMHFTRKRGIQRLARADAMNLPVRENAVDLITLLDLAEHLERDRDLFHEAYRALKPGGRLVLTVPAHAFLWSEHDEALYHKRRYSRRVIKERIEEAGFHIHRLTYCITFTFPLIVGFRLLQKVIGKKKSEPSSHLVILPAWANRLLIWSVDLERLLLRFMNLPFGVTLALVAEKQH